MNITQENKFYKINDYILQFVERSATSLEGSKDLRNTKDPQADAMVKGS